ncbi:MAG: alpha-glucan family phosphorylase [Candidatus Cloacimonetes bacterium]|nr:alpha-glucan family phosphorylase [Candidatus Cloacimonadota bacterium]
MANIRFKKFYVRPAFPDNLNPLLELASNIWTTWDTSAYRLFLRIDPKLFREENHNPTSIIRNISENRIRELSNSAGFVKELETVYRKFKEYLSFEGQYMKEYEKKLNVSEDFKIAYFSMEYGLHESLPIYSGGLGILSGDHLKGASDLGLPLYGFGLLYKLGYFNQRINLEGMQEEIYEVNNWYTKPVHKLLNEDGSEMIFKILLGNETCYIQPWCINVGKIPLYLMDTNLILNKDKFRHITDYLYVTDREMRLLQELVIAYGSAELMKQLKIVPTIYHLNEGHSAFLILKRLEDLINEHKYSYEEAVELIHSSTVFTTHTPVPAGNERFSNDLVEPYLKDHCQAFGKSFNEIKQLAAEQDRENQFSLSVLAIRFSNYINGVSKLHSEVSKEMWSSIYPGVTKQEMPIHGITNGVHIQTWLGPQLVELFDRYVGTGYQHLAEEKSVWENVYSIPDTEIWEAHMQRKQQLISYINKRLEKSLIYKNDLKLFHQGRSLVLDASHLLIGFARRFAPYKRANLILRNPERLLKLLNHPTHPVQFVFAGKAHPADDKGKELIKKIIEFAREHDVQDKFIFLEDYNIDLARHLVQGVDVWLNNPIKPLEASGTSGMKAGMNGVLNLSVLDGWWPECYDGENGWALEAGENIQDQELRDRMEAEELYYMLENEIAPLYYTRNKNGYPSVWISKMINSIYSVGRGFNMHRMLREYVNDFYLPGSLYSKILNQDNQKCLLELVALKDTLTKSWNDVRISDLKLDLHENAIVLSGQKIPVTATAFLNGLDDDLLECEIYYKYDDKFAIASLRKTRTEGEFTIFEGNIKIIGSGIQYFNARLKPRPYLFRDFPHLVKWYY